MLFHSFCLSVHHRSSSEHQPCKQYREHSNERDRNSAHPGGGYILEGKGRQETREQIKQLPTETSAVVTNRVEASGAVAALDGVVGKAAPRR